MKKLLASVSIVALFSASHVQAHPVDPKFLKLVTDDSKTETLDKPNQIREGRKLFFNETFRGNGRTCGTCHSATNNFTIDPAFIAKLPKTNPLFVAENIPALSALENPVLMHRFGLILENLDGFDVPGVMRGVPHTLALPTSTKSDAGTPTRPAFPLANATGWGGDGSPGDGSLLNFAVGAVFQHFTKNVGGDPGSAIQRRPGIDFRVPTKKELNRLLAFQLSLGRRADVSLDGDNGPALVFRDANVEAGKAIFVNGVPGRAGTVRACNACHDEAGANDANGNNRLFDTGVARRPNAPACLDPRAPGDGGFGTTPITVATLPCGVSATFRGNGQFNTPPLIEAADTPPFFHNASAVTLEDAITHYTTDAFNNSPAGGGNAFVLSSVEINQISALLRALNARQNLIDGIAIDNRAISEGANLAPSSIAEALSNTKDALRVLNQSPIKLYQASGIRVQINQAIASEQNALSLSGAARDASLRLAVMRKSQALSLF